MTSRHKRWTTPAAPGALRRRSRGAEVHGGSSYGWRSAAGRALQREGATIAASPSRLGQQPRAHHVTASEFACAFLTAPRSSTHSAARVHTGPPSAAEFSPQHGDHTEPASRCPTTLLIERCEFGDPDWPSVLLSDSKSRSVERAQSLPCFAFCSC